VDFSLTDEQELLLESVQEFAERYFPEDVVKSLYENHGMPKELALEYRDAGFGLMGLPEEYGGVPCDKLTLGMMTEEFYHRTGAMTAFMTYTLTMSDIVEFGSEEQIAACMETYLETGMPTACLAASEPGAGSDNANMTSVTKKQTDGTYILNGQKTWVTLGEAFPNTIVIAKDEDPARDNKNMSLWLIPRSLQGVSTASLEKIGQHSIPFCEMYFDDVVLTEDMRLGEEGRGFFYLMKNFEFERCLIAAQSIGLAKAALDDAVAYANRRETFGSPIAKHQQIMTMLTDMETIIQSSRAMLYQTLWKLDNGISVHLDSAILKRYVCKECTKVADMALEIFAGLGYTTESRIGRLWTDLRGNEFAGGTGEIMVYIAGRQISKKYAQ
jgi:alkylation response protein AidB-like acyl-CoA dehydrogenase